MPDQTPAPFSDRELTEYATGSTVASNPYAAVQDLATELLAAQARITELEREAEFMLGQADNNAKRWTASEIELAEACQWAAWFAAERDYVNRHRREELAINRAHMDRMAVDMDAKDARITELEERNANLDKAFRAAADQAAELATDAYERTQAEEAAQTPREPDAYIAVQRYHSPNAEGPEWFDRAVVFPASDPYQIRDGLEQHGYEFLPIVGTETGTRYAAAPQSDPVVRDA